MPLVLATGAPTASGHDYNDILGKQYEFPNQYRGLMAPGETFAYYMGRRGSRDGRPVYLGVGVIGAIRPSTRSGQLVAELHDVEMFDAPVAAKSSSGTYLESGTTRGTNWTSGVRRIPDDALARIVAAGGSDEPERSPIEPERAAPEQAFATPEHATALERYSVAAAMALLVEEFGAEAVREMPPGNPGYDIVVSRAATDLHVEVKGTVLPDPVFHLSEGQRQHAASRGPDFRLVVVYGVRLAAGTHLTAVVEGPLDESKADLQTQSWIGRLRV